MNIKTRLSPSAAIVISAVLWGTWWYPLRAIYRGGLEGVVPIALGFLVPGVVALLWIAVRHRSLFRSVDRTLLLGIVLISVAFALYAEALLRGYVARVLLMFYLTTIWSSLFARVVLGVPVTPMRLAAIVTGLAGLAVVQGSHPGLPVPQNLAEWMGLASGVSWGLGLTLLHLRGDADLEETVALLLLLTGPAFIIIGLIPGGSVMIWPDAAALVNNSGWILAMAAVWGFPLVWLTLYGGRGVDPGRVAVLLMLEIVVGMGSATALTDEPLGIFEIGGGLLIASAALLDSLRWRPRAGPAANRDSTG